MTHSNCVTHCPSVASTRTLFQRIAAKWHALPLLCNNCCHPIEGDSISESEQVGWCPNCKLTFRVPLFRIPGWVAGVIMVLVIKAQAGC